MNKIEELAAEDFAEISETAHAVMGVSGTFESSGRACLVDGSMYSPSTRALKGGTHAYHIEDDGASMEHYTEELDRLTDAWNTEHAGADVSMFWEDGALWLARSEAE